ncbi:Nitrite reductase [NAD(P)H] [Fundidesulfovibrio magnetotacticus]|uniref:Nitrite reductase [NAD(P)H] n=1 Tax=Fundidesulfovibrio magnetotacticus TaxID=2730080 RepID=A0A6V8LRI6_9BACT|nr:NAD(P)/FAD-dependent oxidoreductase [Fundidesulfovibrio magnetotacticus]GFK95093.1 Nitrite reductase [NAD(P)H] [Fundidesulfovibrio magnetotacticus]
MSKSETPRGAILQRDGETWAIVPRTPVGIITPQVLDALNTVVGKYSIPIVKITSGQRIALVGVKAEEVESIWKDLGTMAGQAVELCVHFVQACPGTSVCKFGVQDSLGLGLELEKLYVGMELPAKVKMGVSGCPLCCASSLVRDLGVIGKKSGFTVSFGGHPGGKPRIADVVAEDLDAPQVVALVKKLLEHYRDNAKKKERCARFVERVGIEAIKAAVL